MQFREKITTLVVNQSELVARDSAEEEAVPNPEISVVIVNYNVKDFLLQCIRSLERAFRNIRGEIIVVDNNSSDNSVAYLQPLFPQIQFVGLSENLGFGRANNLGVEKARGDFILFLNPDTLLEESTLEVMLDYMRRHPDVGMAGCRVLNPDGSFQLSCRRGFPTPWASFCRMFGLQALLPRSRFFAQYNQTFRSENETHWVDAVSGAFMFARRSALQQTGGFDPKFFMYGEDLDLCYRISQKGWKIAYVHSATVIHFKGESTRRSTLDRVGIFYGAMELFVKKHHGGNSLFSLVLRFAISLRAAIAYAGKHRRSLFNLVLDLVAINLSLLLATKLRFGSYFGFPPYAYPAVFFGLSVSTLLSMLMAGEYFEEGPSLRKSFQGLMVNFFLLSGLTYFIKEFGFSRGVLLMTIAFALVWCVAFRALSALLDKSVGKDADRRIAIVGFSEAAERIIRDLQAGERRNADLVGVLASSPTSEAVFCGYPVLGQLNSLPELIKGHRLQEVIIADSSLQQKDLMALITSASDLSVRFHLALDYSDIVVSRIINEVAGIEPTLPSYPLERPRYRLAKRSIDLAGSIFFLTLGSPLAYLLAPDPKAAFKGFWEVLKGRLSLIGIYPLEGQASPGKAGFTGLAHISRPERLSKKVINELNSYYLQHYSLTLDFDILFKALFRRRNRNH